MIDGMDYDYNTVHGGLFFDDEDDDADEDCRGFMTKMLKAVMAPMKH